MTQQITGPARGTAATQDPAATPISYEMAEFLRFLSVRDALPGDTVFTLDELRQEIADFTVAATAGEDRHDRVADGLRRLADFIQSHPELPLPMYPAFQHCVHADIVEDGVRTGDKDDEAGIAEVQQIADALGLPVEVSAGGHRSVSTAFGAVAYGVFYVPQASTLEYRARTSYEHNVQLDGGESR